MTPQKATLDSLRTLSWFVSYRRLSSQFQFSLSLVTLEYLSQWVELAMESRSCFKLCHFSPTSEGGTLCVSLLHLAEDGYWGLELAGCAEAVSKCCHFIITFGGCTLYSSSVSRRGWQLRSRTWKWCRSCFKMSLFHYYLWRMYFASLSCVSKSMAAERLSWQGRKAVLKCRRLIFTFEGYTLCPYPVSRRGWWTRGVISLLPLEDVLCVTLLCLVEDDGWEAELARYRRSCSKMLSFHFYLWMMYFVSLSCVSKRMTAERLNWQWEQKLF
jgi:hypothetical protein